MEIGLLVLSQITLAFVLVLLFYELGIGVSFSILTLLLMQYSLPLL